MAYLRKRFSEGSTWAGLFSMLPQIAALATIGATPAAVAGIAIGIIAVLVPESVNGR